MVEIKLTDKQVNDLVVALNKMPYEVAEPILNNINSQILVQQAQPKMFHHPFIRTAYL